MRLKRTLNAIITGTLLAALTFFGLSWWRPIPILDAGVCSESPVGYYRMQLLGYETTDYGGAELQTGPSIGTTFDMFDYVIFGQPIC